MKCSSLKEKELDSLGIIAAQSAFSIVPVLFLYRFPWFLFLFLCLNTLTKVTKRLTWDFSLGVQSITGRGDRVKTSLKYLVTSATQEAGTYFTLLLRSLLRTVKDPSQGVAPPTVGRSFHTNQNGNPPQACTQSHLPLTLRTNYYTIFKSDFFVTLVT